MTFKIKDGLQIGTTTVFNGSGVLQVAATNLLNGALGSIPYQNAANTTQFVSGNTTNTPQFLTSTGSGGAATAPTLTTSTGTGNVVLATSPSIAGGSITGLTALAVRDTSAAYDVTVAATSSTTLTAGRTVTLDVVNAARSVKLGGNLSFGANFTTDATGTISFVTSGNTSVTLPTSGTLATTGNLSQFASTTSAQLAGVISDETGSGYLVFGTSPTITTSLITDTTGTFSLVNTNATTVNFAGAATAVTVGAITGTTTINNKIVAGSTFGATGISVGTPAQGALTGGVSLSTSTSVSDSIGLLNQTLSLLTPTAPTAFATPNLVVSGGTTTSRLMIVATGSQTNNDATNASTASPGTVVTVVRANTLATTSLTTVAPGNSGTLTVTRNNTTAVTKLLTYGNSTQVLTVNITNTTTSSATVTFSSVSASVGSGVIVVGGLFTANSTTGGFTSGNLYYVTAVTATTITLDNYSAGARTTAFSGTTASGSPLLTLTSATDNSTTTANNTTITITNNVASPVGTPGFFETFDVNISGTSVPAGWNTVRLTHSGTGTSTPYGANTTANGIWYYDSTSASAPTFASNTFALGTSNTINSSTIPHYTSSTTYNIGFTLTHNWGQTGHASTSSSVITTAAVGPWQTSGNKTYSNLGYTTTFPTTTTVTSGAGPNSTTFVANIITGFGLWATTTTVPVITADNSYLTGTSSLPALNAQILYKTGTTSSTTFIEETSLFFNTAIGTGSGAAARVVNPDGGTANTNTPAFTAGSAAFSTLLATDATVVGTSVGATGHAIKHDLTNYSTGYLPAGPDLSARTSGNGQYFTFRFARTGVQIFDLTITTAGSTAGIAGLWSAMSGFGSISGYNANTNGWLDWSIDAGLAQGCGYTGGTTGRALFVAGSTNGTYRYRCSFNTASSTNATNNEIWVRIKLTSGQQVTAIYLDAPN